MDLCLTSQVISALDAQVRHPTRRLKVVFFRNRLRRRHAPADVRPVIMAPSAALLQSVVGSGLGFATAGLTRYGIIHGGSRSLFPDLMVMNSAGLVSTLFPFGVYVGSMMLFKHGFALNDPLDSALATGLACRLAQWSPSVALASAVQVGLYESEMRRRAEALGDEEPGFDLQSSLVAGMFSGLTYLAVESVRSAKLQSFFPRPMLKPFVLISALHSRN